RVAADRKAEIGLHGRRMGQNQFSRIDDRSLDRHCGRADFPGPTRTLAHQQRHPRTETRHGHAFRRRTRASSQGAFQPRCYRVSAKICIISQARNRSPAFCAPSSALRAWVSSRFGSNCMPTVADIIRFLEAFAPPRRAAEWDNVGLILGERSASVERILTCLTVMPEVVAEAIEA